MRLPDMYVQVTDDDQVVERVTGAGVMKAVATTIDSNI